MPRGVRCAHETTGLRHEDVIGLQNEKKINTAHFRFLVGETTSYIIYQQNICSVSQNMPLWRIHRVSSWCGDWPSARRRNRTAKREKINAVHFRYLVRATTCSILYQQSTRSISIRACNCCDMVCELVVCKEEFGSKHDWSSARRRNRTAK